MVSFARSALSFVIAASATSTVFCDNHIRSSAQRIRNPDSATVTPSISSLASVGSLIQKLVADPLNAIDILSSERPAAENSDQLEGTQEEFNALMEVMASIAAEHSSMSMMVPLPVEPTLAPVSTNVGPSKAPTNAPSSAPVAAVTGSPVAVPTQVETEPPVLTPTTPPLTSGPTTAPETPTLPPVAAPVLTATPVAPIDIVQTTLTPTLSSCPGISRQQRIEQILAILVAVADVTEISDPTTSQGKATAWIIEQDQFSICPDNVKLVQRWALAVVYFSAGGDNWTQCSANPAATDICGSENPFVGKSRFLSADLECDWAGITCVDGCVTEVEFEENNLGGTIATEIGLLTDLQIWGMERGTLSSTIPTEISRLTNLVFLDLDFNELTGTLSPELLGLQSLTQLDLNNNLLSGSIDGIGSFPQMQFMQLHDNRFTGTVPASMGAYTDLGAFTLHETQISGEMPQEVCALIEGGVNGGSLRSLIADCSEPNPNIVCTCCTDCRLPQINNL